MKIRLPLWGGVFVCLLAMVLCGTAYAQVTTADILGTVTDPSGAILPGAQVTINNDATGLNRTMTTGPNGEYIFTLLPVGTYSVSVEAKGFKKHVSKVTLALGDRARVNAAMEVGQQSETVEVEAIAPALHTDSSVVGTLITSQAVQDLPVSGRNFIDLVQLSAGVTPGLGNALSSGTRPDDRRMASVYSANGQSDIINNNMIDGMDNNERIIGTIGVRPSIDAIQEFKVSTNNYTAEVGRSAGGVVDLITKSGSNNFHGSAFEFLRNDIFDANTWAAPHGSKKAKLRQNQFGGSIGGPIVKNKTFFFGDYEGFRQIQGNTTKANVPSAQIRANPLLAFYRNVDTDGNPATPAVPQSLADAGFTAENLSPIGLAYLNLFPQATVPTADGNVGAEKENYVGTVNRTQFGHTFDARVDHRFNDKNTFFARYSFNDVSTTTPDPFPAVDVNGTKVQPGGGGIFGFQGVAEQRAQALAMSFVHIFQPTLILELKAGYMRSAIESMPVNQNNPEVAAALGLGAVSAQGFTDTFGLPGASGFAGVNIATQKGTNYSGLGDSAFLPINQFDNSFQYAGIVTWTKGSHALKLGSGFIRRQALIGQSNFGIGWMNASLGELLIGRPASIQRAVSLQAPALRTWEPYWFVQDDWRATKWLTFNLGLRYEVFTPYTAANKAISNWDPVKKLIVSPALDGANHSSATANIKTDYKDFSPRIGFAATFGRGFVFRGGYGISFFPGNYTSGAALKNAPFNFSFACGGSNPACAAPYGNTNGWDMAAGLPAPVMDTTLATDPLRYAGQSVNATDPNYKSSYIHQFTFIFEKELAGNVVSAGYIGNRGRRLTIAPNMNQQQTPGGTRLFTDTNMTINQRQSKGWSHYDALQLTFVRRLRNGLTADANYTWSHNMTNAPVTDEGQNSGNCVGTCLVDNGQAGGGPSTWDVYDWGNADLDVRHRVSVSLNYDIPFGKSSTGIVGQIVKGWSTNAIYSYQTGQALTVVSNGFSPAAFDNGIFFGGDRPNMTGSAKLDHPTVGQWFDTSVFMRHQGGTLGNERRNQVVGPPRRQFNTSLFKAFPIREQMSLQFRMEIFNLFNTPNYNNPVTTFSNYFSDPENPTDPRTGHVTDTTFGTINGASGSRQIQFALKFLF